MASGDIPMDSLDRVDAARMRLETLDRVYNQTLDKLEVSMLDQQLAQALFGGAEASNVGCFKEHMACTRTTSCT